MLDLHHQHTSKPLKVLKPAQSTKGTYTNPKGRYYPTRLRPWTDFLLSQEGRFEKLRAIWPTQRLFAPSLTIDHVGKQFCVPLSSEYGVRLYTWFAVEANVWEIFAKLLANDDAKACLNLVGGVKFESHLNVLSDSSEEVPAERAFIPVDQYSIIERTDGNDDDDNDSPETTLRDIVFLIEYKAAHEVTAETLRRVLGNGDFDIKKLINTPKVENDKAAREVYRSEMEAAAAISQLFGYMVQAGTEYGYITTGKSFLFLRVKENEPTTAYYHLAVPNEDVNELDLSRTSISQVLCFSLLALQSKPRDQQWIRGAIRDCGIWATDDEEIVSQMSPEKPIREPKDSAYRSTGKSDVISSYGTRSKDRRNNSSFGSNDTAPDSSRDRSDDQAQSPSSQVTTQSKTSSGTSAKNVGLSQRSASEQQSMPFCSHQCLLGLVCGTLMDTECPNYHIHPKVSCDSSVGMHSLDMSSLQNLLRDQLAETMDTHCTPMRKQGARGAMFKLTLASHGYTVVGKGTVQAFVPDLRLENQFYDRLRFVQGSIVPVCLGNFDCVYPYYYHFATEIVHFLLLSWAGEALSSSSQACWDSHADEIVRMNDQLWSLGVAHGAIRPENVLWNESLGQLMFIDFERSKMIPQRKAKPNELTSSPPPTANTAKSKVLDTCVYADNVKRFELCSSPTKKRNRSSSVDDTIKREHRGSDMDVFRSAKLQMV
ncbi:hypothetical protein BDR22DRAFT_925720 [Usnea florida]